MQCADGPPKEQQIKLADLWITMEAANGKQISFRHPVEMYSGLNDNCYIGYDLLGGPRTVFQTPNSIALKTNVHAEHRLTISGNEQTVFIIPIHNDKPDQNNSKQTKIEFRGDNSTPDTLNTVSITMTDNIHHENKGYRQTLSIFH